MSIPEHVVAQWHKQAMSGTDEQGFGPNSCWGKFAALASKWDATGKEVGDSVAVGDVIVIETPGGGGYGEL